MLEKINKLSDLFTKLLKIMDEWTKVFNKRLLDVESMINRIDDMDDRIEYDFDKINDMKQEMISIKNEITSIKMVQMLMREKKVENIHSRFDNHYHPNCPEKIEPEDFRWPNEE